MQKNSMAKRILAVVIALIITIPSLCFSALAVDSGVDYSYQVTEGAEGKLEVALTAKATSGTVNLNGGSFGIAWDSSKMTFDSIAYNTAVVEDGTDYFLPDYTQTAGNFAAGYYPKNDNVTTNAYITVDTEGTLIATMTFSIDGSVNYDLLSIATDPFTVYALEDNASAYANGKYQVSVHNPDSLDVSFSDVGLTTFAWEVNEYTYKFMDGVNNTEVTADFGTKIPAYTGTAPVKASTNTTTYTFSGQWSLTEGGTTSIAFPYTLTKDEVFYPIFDAATRKYTVTFMDATGGTHASVTDYEYNADIATPGTSPTKTATAEYSYNFLGWNTDNTATAALESLGKVTGDGIVFYPIFSQTAVNYTVSWKNEDKISQYVADTTVAYASAITAPTPAPIKEGYDFAGWYYMEGATETALPEKMPAKNIVAYAKFTVNEYTIKYTIAGMEAEITDDYGADVTEPSTIITGYTFVSWYTTAAFNEGTAVSFPETMPAGGITLFAKHTPTEYNITFKLDGGNIGGATTDVAVTYDITTESITLPTDPVKEGYNFAGWYVATAEGEIASPETAYTFAEGGTGAKYVIAKWTKKTYAITLVKGNSTVAVSGFYSTEVALDAVEHGKAVTLTFTPSAGYEITAITAPNGVVNLTAGTVTYANVTAADTVTVTTQKITYNYTFNLDGGKIGESTANVTGTYQLGADNFTPANPTKEGFTFVKWVYEDGGADFTYTTTTIGNINVKATWTAVKYTYKFEVGADEKIAGGELDADVTAAIDFGTAIPNPGDASKTATAQHTYTFSKWRDAANEVDYVAGMTMPAKDLTFAPVFTTETNKYAVTFPAENDMYTVTVNSLTSGNSVDYGTVLTIAVSPKAAYSAATPVIKVNGNVVTSTYTVVGTTVITVDALAKNTYDVVFKDKDGVTLTGTGYENVKVTHGAAVDGNTVDGVTVPAVPAVTGYTGGWVLQAAGVTDNAVIGSIEYKAVYTINKYAVTYTASGIGYTVSATKGTGETITAVASGAEVDYNTEVTFKITLDAAYSNSEPTVEGATLAKDGNVYTFTKAITEAYTMPAVNNVAKNTYAVTLAGDTANFDYVITPATINLAAVEHGTAFTVAFTAKTGYTITGIKKGEAANEGNTVTFAADELTGAITITVTAPLNTYAVAFKDKDGNALTGTGYDNITASHGAAVTGNAVANVTLPAVPAVTGYTGGAWVLDASGIDDNKVVGAITFKASNYVINKYAISLTKNNSTVAVTGDYTAEADLAAVEHGKAVTLTFTATTGYKITGITAPKGVVDANAGTVTYASVTSADDVTVTTEVMTYAVKYNDAEGNAFVPLVDDGTVAHFTIVTEGVVTGLVPPAVPAKTGYTGNWVLQATGITDNAVTGQIEFRAVYTINKYAVTYTASGIGYTVSATKGTGETITAVASGAEVDYNTEVTFKITLDAAYSNSEPTVDGATLEKNGNVSTFTKAITEAYTMPAVGGITAKNIYNFEIPTMDGDGMGKVSAQATHGEDTVLEIKLPAKYSQMEGADKTITMLVNGNEVTATYDTVSDSFKYTVNVAAAPTITVKEGQLVLNKYNITFTGMKNADGTAADAVVRENVEHGSTTTAPAPESYVSNGITYNFDAWSPAFVPTANVTSDATYTATYKAMNGAVNITLNTQRVAEPGEKTYAGDRNVNATFTLVNGESNPVEGLAISEVGSAVTISGAVPAGTYTLTVSKQRYVDHVITLTVVNGERSEGTGSLLAGDVVGNGSKDGDNKIDLDDFIICIRAFDTNADVVAQAADINESGTVTIEDLVNIKTNFGASAATTATVTNPQD